MKFSHVSQDVKEKQLLNNGHLSTLCPNPGGGLSQLDTLTNKHTKENVESTIITLSITYDKTLNYQGPLKYYIITSEERGWGKVNCVDTLFYK